MKRVRYVGVPDPRVARKAEVKALLAAGVITEANIWKENTKRLGGNRETGPSPVVALIPGVTVRSLSKREGLSRTIKWGPKPDSYVQEISNADWEAIQRLAEAHHWELVEEPAALPETVEQPETPAED